MRMILTFTVDSSKQLITRTDTNQPVEKSMNYLQANFELDAETTNTTNRAIFRNSRNACTIELTGGSCFVPEKVIKSGGFSVTFVAYDESHAIRCTTNTISIPVIPSGYDAGNTPCKPSPDVYESIKTEIDNIQDRVRNIEEGGGTIGQDGTTFTPSVDEEGYLSWSNDGNKPNPQTVCIKGEQGIQGEQGEQGQQGIQGEQGQQGIQGEQGVGISSILLTSSAGNIDTYTVTLTNGNTSTFTVTNGTVGECVTVTDSNAETANAGIMDYTIQPNILYIFPTLIELNLTFAEGTSGKINEYMFQVTADGTEGLTLSYPNGVAFSEQISGTANKTYEINVVNNKGLSVEW